MKLWLLLPVKPLAEAKSRLAPVLAPQERSDLLVRLLARTVQVAHQAQPLAKILVISRDLALLARAQQWGAQALVERGDDLNAALEQGCEAAVQGGADALLILPTDLPLLRAADVEALCELAAGGADVVISESRDGGTNALLVPLPAPIAFQFGPDSFAAHQAAAQRVGCSVAVYTSPTLAFDLDWPEDLAAIAAIV